MTRRLLFVHAHPDDEASKGAATAARYVDEGADVVLVTCTDGSAGEVLNPKSDPVEASDMARVRALELDASVHTIGFTRSHRLGFVDSGYHEDPADIPPGTFAALPLDDTARVLADILRYERPHVVVTYPPDGGYPHPDHIRVHTATMRAIELAADPNQQLPTEDPWQVSKVYATLNNPMERLEAIHTGIRERGSDEPYREWLDRRRERPHGPVPTARIRCADYFPKRDAALIAHVTQIDPDGNWFLIPRDVEREHYPYDAYTLLDSRVPTEADETDLFAGISPADLDGHEVGTSHLGGGPGDRGRGR